MPRTKVGGGVCDCPGPNQITRLYGSAVQCCAVVARSSLVRPIYTCSVCWNFFCRVNFHKTLFSLLAHHLVSWLPVSRRRV
ncbi:unnamed protein product [Ectocarpus sp. 6 AP-2014]